MNNQFWVLISPYTVLLPSIIGAVRFKYVLKAYRPFIYLIWVALCNEIVSQIVVATIKNTTVNNNIYTLIDYSFIIWFFMSLDETGKKNKYYVLLGFGAIAWFVDNILLNSITGFSSYFRIIYGLIVVYLSVGKLNEVLFNEIRHSLKNATLIICISFIIGYSYQAVLEVFGVIKMHIEYSFYKRLYYILIDLNIFNNLLYALAMLWLPTKRQFTLPY